MKKIFLLLFLFVSVATTVSAQGGNRRTPEERAAVIHAKLDSAFKVDAQKLTTLDAALVTSFKAQDVKRSEMMSGGTPDREAMQAEMRKFTDERDALIKAALTADQYATWKEKIEPSMRPQRPGGGGGGGN
jgi:hypothetical protein